MVSKLTLLNIVYGINQIIRHPHKEIFSNYLDVGKAFLHRNSAIANICEVKKDQVDLIINNINPKLINYLQGQYRERGHDSFLDSTLSPIRGPVYYTICRIIKPDKVVETGVSSGISSAFILQALEDNQKGKLYSIDFPSPDALSKDLHYHKDLASHKQPGWIIPDELRYRHELIIGKTSEKLQPLLSKLKIIDIFLHDSDHRYENMKFEFNLAWPYLKTNGLLLSDDINLHTAFNEFVDKHNLKFIELAKFGMVKKP